MSGPYLGWEGPVPCALGGELLFQAQVVTWFMAQLLEQAAQLSRCKGWLLVAEWFAPSPSCLEEERMGADG